MKQLEINKINKEIKINSPEEEIDFHSMNNLDNYTEIIPQKIEKENKKEKNDYNITIENENILDQNLEFSFGKDLKKRIETNRLKTDYLEKKEVLSDNLSNYQMTDSISNFIENEEGNKKMKIIKEKFISNFKSKDRNESLERAFTLFEKFHNNLNNNKMNLSFSHKLEKPFQFLTSQNLKGFLTKTISVLKAVPLKQPLPSRNPLLSSLTTHSKTATVLPVLLFPALSAAELSLCWLSAFQPQAGSSAERHPEKSRRSAEKRSL